MSYGSSFITNIIDNIQLKINDVHLRYEDKLTDPEHPFSWGIIINGLYAQSTDESWVSGSDVFKNLFRNFVRAATKSDAHFIPLMSTMLWHYSCHYFFKFLSSSPMLKLLKMVDITCSLWCQCVFKHQAVWQMDGMCKLDYMCTICFSCRDSHMVFCCIAYIDKKKGKI